MVGSVSDLVELPGTVVVSWLGVHVQGSLAPFGKAENRGGVGRFVQEARRRAADWLAARHGPWARSDWAVAAIAAMLVVVRWPDRARFLFTWDSHTFALALERYDVNGLRPHAPGYPVYVAMGRAFNTVIADHNDAYIALSVVACAVGAMLTYAIGRRLSTRAVAVAATSLVLGAPLLHAHAMTANAYAADLAFGTAVALAALRCAERPSTLRTVALAATFGVAVGVRQSLGFFLLPLVAWAALRPPWDLRAQARRLLPAAATGTLVGLAWFLPMANASGGIAAWRRANALQSDVVFEHPVWRDGWSMLEVNAERMALYLKWELRILLPALAAIVALGLVLRLMRAGERWDRRKARPADATVSAASFLALWGLPPLLFYLLVYSGYGNGPSGYALILLPPIALASCMAARAAVGTVSARVGTQAVVAGTVLAAVLAGFLANLHDVADGDYHGHDEWVDSWNDLPRSFPPSNTSIVTAYNFAHVWYYYPDYQVFEYRPPGKAVGEVPDFLMVQEANGREAVPDWYDEIADRDTPGPHPFRPGTENLVLFDFQLAGENGGERQLRPEVEYREAWLPNDWRVLYVRLDPSKPNLEDYFTLDGAL